MSLAGVMGSACVDVAPSTDVGKTRQREHMHLASVDKVLLGQLNPCQKPSMEPAAEAGYGDLQPRVRSRGVLRSEAAVPWRTGHQFTRGEVLIP